MAEQDLTGKTALITGAGTRLGAAIARTLARAGCDLLVHFSTNAAGAELVAEETSALGRRALPVRADLTDRNELATLAAKARTFAKGNLALLVHNAANFDRIEPLTLSAEAWDRALALNLTAPYLLTIELAQELRATQGSVVAISDISAEKPWKNYIPYSVSKAGLAHLVRSLAVGYAPHIRVNAVAPGTVLPPEHYDAERREQLRQKTPLGRLGTPEDIARAVLFLAQNDYITGEVLAVDGGRVLV